MRFGHQRLVDRCREAAEKLIAILFELLGVPEARPRRDDVGGVQTNALYGGAVRIVAEDTPELMLHAGVGCWQQKTELAPKAADIGIASAVAHRLEARDGCPL